MTLARLRCHALRAACLIAFCATLSACKMDLNTNLSEREANDIIAVLLENGIDADKLIESEQSVTVQIDEKDLLKAVTLLKKYGLPKKERETLGSVFKKNGIMSSPFEERVRFNFALSQELSNTLEDIDGVLSARVHIVLPEAAELGKKVVPSSAAVFIKHRPGVDMDFLAPQIKRLVSNSIEGMSYDKVSLVLVEAEDMAGPAPSGASEAMNTFAGFRILSDDKGNFFVLVYAVAAAVFVLVAAIVVLLFAYFRMQRKMRSHGNPADREYEPA